MVPPADAPNSLNSMSPATTARTTTAGPQSFQGSEGIAAPQSAQSALTTVATATAPYAPADADGVALLRGTRATGADDGMALGGGAGGEAGGLESSAQHPGLSSLPPQQAVAAVSEPMTVASTAATIESEQARQTVAQLGALVTEAASALVLDDRRWRSARRTQWRQHDDLVRFARFLAELAAHAGLPFTDPADYAERLATDLREWQSISWGHVQAHMAWLLDRGYAIGTIDNALSTLKVYARLAQRAGALGAEDLARILDLHPFGYRGGLIVDDHRPADKRRRPGAKKGRPTMITAEEARVLKTAHPDDPRGRRDAFLLTLFIDHGLRVGELVALRLEDIEGIEGMAGIDARASVDHHDNDHERLHHGPDGQDRLADVMKQQQDSPHALQTDASSASGASTGRARLRHTRLAPTGATSATRAVRGAEPLVLLRVHRPKVKKEQRHALTPDSVAALRRYLEVRRTVEPATSGPLLCATHPHSPALVVAGMTENGIHKRVKALGRDLLGVDDLGPHDLRHFWATSAARGKTAFDRLVRAGGWNSPAMPLRYIDAEEIANTGVVLDHLR